METLQMLQEIKHSLTVKINFNAKRDVDNHSDQRNDNCNDKNSVQI